MKRAALVTAVFLSACGWDASPRPAVGCQGPQLAIYVWHVMQESADGASCARFDFGGVEEPFRGFPNVVQSGPLAMWGATRFSGPCAGLTPPELGGRPDATSPMSDESLRGEIESTETAVTRALVEVDFRAAWDGSLGPTSFLLSARDVDLTDRCRW